MLKDEVSILKSLMIRLDDNTAFVVTYQYHTERNEYGKVDRSKSKYRWFARVFKIDNLINKIKWLCEDANRLNKFKWPNDPWPWYTCAKYPENYSIASWLSTKYKKIYSWEDGQKILNGWETKTANREGGYNTSAKYEIDDYLDESGNIVSLSDKNALMKRVGQNLIKTKNNC